MCLWPQTAFVGTFAELEAPMLHANFQDHRTSGSGEEDGAPRGFGDLGRRAIYFQGAGEHC